MDKQSTAHYQRTEADGTEDIVLVRGYRALRATLNDWQTFSSDTHGMLVLTPQDKTRYFKQYPFELDPPEHTAVRGAVEGYFRRPLEPDYAESLGAIIRDAVTGLLSGEDIDVTHGFSLPLQSRALTVLLGMPESEADIWVQWGINVFVAESDDLTHDYAIDDGKADTLVSYVEEMTDRADAGDVPPDSFFAVLARAEVDGRPLTRHERLGFAHIAFAGGRDTVIGLITGIIGLFAQQPHVPQALRHDPDLVKSATEEVIRLISPLRVLMRTCPAGGEVDGVTVEPGQRVAVCYGSASHDPSKFEDPETFRIDRAPNPHLAFGAGPHTCLGNAHARQIARLLMLELAQRLDRFDIVDAVPEDESSPFDVEGLRFSRLIVRGHETA
jgi:cytochrome P450